MKRALFALTIALAAACGSDRGGGSDGSRPVNIFNGVPFGATCESDADCGGQKDACCTGGKCGAEGWCSPKCASDQDCPGGFFCVDHDGARCFAACVNDSDCPVDFICEEKSNHLTCRFKG